MLLALTSPYDVIIYFADSQGCVDEGAQCDNGLMCTYVIGDSGSCYCASMGELCTGNCSGAASQLTSGTQQCTSETTTV